MATKHFLINPNSNPSAKEDILEVEKIKVEKVAQVWDAKEKKAQQAFEKESFLKHTFGRVIVKVDIEKKNYHTFEDGTIIRRERKFNEFNRRITQPSNAIVISGEGIEKGSEILISHNAIHDTNKIFDYRNDSPNVQYFSIPEYDCFAWRNKEGVMQPLTNFEFALRVFKPYEGMIIGQPPTEIKNILYITTGELKGKVVHTLEASDYTIIYQELNGKEGAIVRIRHSEDDTFDREEITCISHDLTEKVERGTLLIGITTKDCKKLKEYETGRI